jgi:hypothetical protein
VAPSDLGGYVLSADQLPTLWDPEALFSHLALWAGAPAIVVAVVVWLLGIYSSARSWFGFGRSARRMAAAGPRKYRDVQNNLRSRTTVQQRATVRLFFSSVFTVAFSYMLAEIIYVFVQMTELNSAAPFSLSDMRTIAVAVTPWSPPVVLTVILEVIGIALLGVAFIAELPRLERFVTFLGGTARAIARIGTAVLCFCTVGAFVSPYISSNQGPSAAAPISLAVTIAVTAALFFGLARSLTKVREASELAFKVKHRIEHIYS